VAWALEPAIPAAADLLREHLPTLGLSRRTLLLIGRCSVEYQGRAQSHLDTGDRVVLVKADGTLLVHNPDGLKPVNWQPPGCTFGLESDGSSLVLVARRPRPAETVRMRFDRIDLAGVIHLADGQPLQLRGTEFDVRDTLRARPELVEPGFVPWERERQSERGPMDLYGEDAQGRRVIVEVKRTRAGLAEATQLWRYVEKERTKRGVAVRGILVAPAVSERARLLLEEHGLEVREVSLESLAARSVPLETRSQPSLLAFEDDADAFESKRS
jgi:endonuclease